MREFMRAKHIANFARVASVLSKLAMKNYWLVKQEPEAYSWDDFVRDGLTRMDRGAEFPGAQKSPRDAQRRRRFLLSQRERQSGRRRGEVTREAFPDPTAKEGDWSAVELKPVKAVEEASHARADQGRAEAARHRVVAVIRGFRCSR